MPHDKNGVELRVDTQVLIPARVVAVHLTKDYCNVDLELTERMPPGQEVTRVTVNSRQTFVQTDQLAALLTEHGG